MKKHYLTLIETPYPNLLREGDIYVDIDETTGLIKTMQKRVGGKMVSMLEEKQESTQQSLIDQIHNNYAEA